MAECSGLFCLLAEHEKKITSSLGRILFFGFFFCLCSEHEKNQKTYFSMRRKVHHCVIWHINQILCSTFGRFTERSSTRNRRPLDYHWCRLLRVPLCIGHIAHTMMHVAHGAHLPLQFFRVAVVDKTYAKVWYKAKKLASIIKKGILWAMQKCTSMKLTCY